ncbi:Dioxygenase [Petrocella atlantisensis]|uniref:Dioxygenase n=1 Tax=Petrocella atlantisensis TaxID=2173034 RepID=A0A3P7P3Y5_9FIRM|nr:class III extradiol ring-cleavage dioxygenase [Petrocella atlantisensis]VDN48270.1 Dioxygenase [Petrocella atlantisensis]
MHEEPSKNNGQVIYFSHGGGPLPLLKDASHDKMIQFMRELPNSIKKPDLIIVFSAHWEEDTVTIQSGMEPEMVYDYYGFPEAAYSIQYPCKGDHDQALKIAEIFKKNGIECRLDNHRPYDHGSYIPLSMMYPKADIPVLQISLHHSLDPLIHLSIGKALRPLLEENVLIIGSGFSFHNMKQFFLEGKNIEDPKNSEFQDKLIEVCCHEKNENKKWEDFINWESFPNARYCHPREEHLLPLLVCIGLSEDTGTKVFDNYILRKRATAFLWF